MKSTLWMKEPFMGWKSELSKQARPWRPLATLVLAMAMTTANAAGAAPHAVEAVTRSDAADGAALRFTTIDDMHEVEGAGRKEAIMNFVTCFGVGFLGGRSLALGAGGLVGVVAVLLTFVPCI
jgi:hypothetical protein